MAGSAIWTDCSPDIYLACGQQQNCFTTNLFPSLIGTWKHESEHILMLKSISSIKHYMEPLMGKKKGLRRPNVFSSSQLTNKEKKTNVSVDCQNKLTAKTMRFIHGDDNAPRLIRKYVEDKRWQSI